ncbi:hypothetical protein NEIG_00690 [Nematocida sp. ERTm5]|nr:hypothetical protein NEIG_00690 [Nematocida sp. ERTm5]
MNKAKDIVGKDDSRPKQSKKLSLLDSEESSLSEEDNPVESIMAINIGMQMLRIDILRDNGTAKIKLHFHPREISDVCTQICKELLQCTLNSKYQGKRKNVKKFNFSCAQCGTSTTPLWRRHGHRMVCNACGLYFRTHGGLSRPKRLFKTASKDSKKCDQNEPINEQNANK